MAELLSIGAEFFSQDAIREMTSPSSEAGSERSDSAQSDASTVFRSNTSSPPGRISANYPAGGLSKPRPTRASLMRETSGKTYAAAAEAAIVAEAAKDLRQLPAYLLAKGGRHRGGGACSCAGATASCRAGAGV